MKFAGTLVAMMVLSTQAFAYPGSHTLVCSSTEGAKDKKQLSLSMLRANDKGWVPPTVSMNIDGKEYQFTTPDELSNYGQTFHNSPLKVITVNFDNSEENGIIGYFSLTAIPETVTAFDFNKNPVRWNLEEQKELGWCYDSDGSAKFKAIFRGWINAGEGSQEFDSQILDCELTYNSGMGC